MKYGKAPTKAQQIYLRSYGFDPANWLIVKNTDKKMTVVHRRTGTIRKFLKEKTQ